MKKLIYFILLIIMMSCKEAQYEFKSTQFIKGIVLDKEQKFYKPYGYLYI